MRKYILPFVLSSLIGCGGPTIDASSDEAMERSVEEVRADLPIDQRKKFDEALRTITFAEVDLSGIMASAFAGGEMPDPEEAVKNVREKLHGLSGEEILAKADSIIAEREAEERRQGLAKIAELEQRKTEATAAKAELQKFEVVRARYWKEKDYFGMLEPRIRLTVRNGMDKAISRAYFRGTLKSPGRSVPWLAEAFNYSIPGGLEPGEEATWTLSPSQFSEWGSVNAPSDAALYVDVTQLDGAGGAELYSTFGFTEDDQAQLDALRKQYGGS